VVITSASTHKVKTVTEFIDNVAIKLHNLSSFKKERRKRKQTSINLMQNYVYIEIYNY
jgi:hypothetical protein